MAKWGKTKIVSVNPQFIDKNFYQENGEVKNTHRERELRDKEPRSQASDSYYPRTFVHKEYEKAFYKYFKMKRIR